MKVNFWTWYWFVLCIIMIGTNFFSMHVSKEILATATRFSEILNDPHHCVSVCAKEFEKMGC